MAKPPDWLRNDDEDFCVQFDDIEDWWFLSRNIMDPLEGRERYVGVTIWWGDGGAPEIPSYCTGVGAGFTDPDKVEEIGKRFLDLAKTMREEASLERGRKVGLIL